MHRTLFSHLRTVAVVGLGSLMALIAGCTTLPPLDGRVASTTLTDVDQTPLAGRALPPPGTPPERNTGIRPLGNPLEAFAARVLLARAAQRSLDVQYYIWHGDTTGMLMLQELFDAAARGVRVRLLIDDNGLGVTDEAIALLSAHPNAEVRLFNPFVGRGKTKLLGFVTDFSRLNRRMHNKSFTADASATIVGGRNVGDEYFGASDSALFADLDVLALGQAARDVSSAFDLYWNGDSAYPVETLIGAPADGASERLQAEFEAVRGSEDARRYDVAVRERAERALSDAAPPDWVRAKLVYDDPVKAEGQADASGLLFTRLMQVVGEAHQSLDLVSPYFVPGRGGTEALAALARSGVAVRIVTNSLASSDGVAVHAGYARYRKDLLRAGVRLFETKPDPALQAEKGAGRLRGSSGATLHAKTFAIDRDHIFVGSFNLDPRSLWLNTEMGLVIYSADLASQLSEALDSGIASAAYEVRLRDDGDGIEWIEHRGQEVVRHQTEPASSLARRMGVGIISLLPIEWLL